MIVSEVRIYAGLCVDRIEFRFTDGSCSFVGGQGGSLKATLALDDDEFVVMVEHEPLVQRLFAGAGVSLTTNKRRKVSCWPRVATRSAHQITTVRSSSPSASIVGLVLHDGQLTGAVEDVAPKPSGHRDVESERVVAFYWVFTMEGKEPSHVVRRRGFGHGDRQDAIDACTVAMVKEGVLGSLAVCVETGRIIKRAGTTAAHDHICRDGRAARLIGWKSKRSTTFVTLFWRMLSITGAMEQWKMVAVSYAALTLRALLDGLQPLITGLIFNTIGIDDRGSEGKGGSGGKRGAVLLRVIRACSLIDDEESSLLKSLILSLFVTAALRAALSALHTCCSIRVQELAVLRLRSRLVQHLLLQEVQWFDDLRAGEAARFADPTGLSYFLNRVLPQFVADTVKLVVTLFFLASISPLMTATYLVVLPATVKLSREVVEKPMTRIKRQTKQHQLCLQPTP